MIRRLIALAALLALALPPLLANAVPAHVETWAGYYYGGVGEGRNSPAATMRRWVTYLDGGWPHNRDVCDVPGHPCMSVDYLDASNEYFGTCGYSEAVAYGGLTQDHTLAETAWLHVRPPLVYQNRVFNNHYTHCAAATENTGLFINKKSVRGPGNALSFFNAFTLKKYGTRWPDFFMNDDVSVTNDLWPTRTAAYEYSSWIDLQNAQAAFLGGETDYRGRPVRTFFNGCGNNPATIPGVTLIKIRPNIVGCITEDNTTASSLRNGRVLYSLDNCARVTLNPNGGIFVNGPDGDSGLEARLQATAFNMLCYVPKREVFWEEAEWGGKYVNVFQEEGLYPTRPRQSMRFPSECPDETISAASPGNTGTTLDPCRVHGHNDLLFPGLQNVYRREFGLCYDRGTPHGACAVVWNLGDGAVAVPQELLVQRYTRVIALSGGTLDEGGVLRYEHLSAHIVIPPYDAIVLSQ